MDLKKGNQIDPKALKPLNTKFVLFSGKRHLGSKHTASNSTTQNFANEFRNSVSFQIDPYCDSAQKPVCLVIYLYIVTYADGLTVS